MHYEIAIGDVHGRADKLKELLSLLPRGEHRVIMLGDYVDRGPNSAQVVEFLMLSGIECLKGNHEQLMIDGADSMSSHGLWLANGGLATLDSYIGTHLDIEKHREWMASLPHLIESDHRIFVHAGLNPRRRDIAEQREEEVTWIRDPWLMSDYDWGKHVVHGHTHTWGRKKTSEVELLPNRTNLDTAAFHTGILSAAIFDEDIPGPPLQIIRTTP